MWIVNYIGVYIIVAPFLLLTLPGYWNLFKKAGWKGWEALVPFYCSYVMLKISGRPTWWLIWLFVPIANIIVGTGIYIDFIKSYGKLSIRKQLAAVFLPFIYLPKWGFDKTQYIGPSSTVLFKQQHGKTAKRPAIIEWGIPLVCTITVAMFIRAFIIETFVIPTPSMERTLLVGDYIFVSKFSYGARLPMTPLSIPFTNHSIPQTDVKAYSNLARVSYHRLPGFREVKKGDVVVFNYPMDADSPLYRPVDKREFFIKRCEGTPGDTLSIVNAQVYINNKKTFTPNESQIDYTVKTTGIEINPEVLNELHVSFYEGNASPTMTAAAAGNLKGYSNIKTIVPNISPNGVSDTLNPVFPSFSPLHVIPNAKVPDYKWNVDNYGPIIIPKKGWTVKLDSLTFPIYERAIEVYENNKVQVVGNTVLINGKTANSYTFKMDYYWMMGDNRHDSFDSIFWGFVPEDHIVGKALFTWMSYDENAPLPSKIRWDRLFKAIN